jgi:hypothetical protein
MSRRRRGMFASRARSRLERRTDEESFAVKQLVYSMMAEPGTLPRSWCRLLRRTWNKWPLWSSGAESGVGEMLLLTH